VYIYTCVYIYTQIYTHIYIYIYLCTYICRHIYVEREREREREIRIYIHICGYMYMCIHMCVCLCAYTCSCIRTYWLIITCFIYRCIYIYTRLLHGCVDLLGPGYLRICPLLAALPSGCMPPTRSTPSSSCSSMPAEVRRRTQTSRISEDISGLQNIYGHETFWSQFLFIQQQLRANEFGWWWVMRCDVVHLVRLVSYY